MNPSNINKDYNKTPQQQYQESLEQYQKKKNTSQAYLDRLNGHQKNTTENVDDVKNNILKK